MLTTQQQNKVSQDIPLFFFDNPFAIKLREESSCIFAASPQIIINLLFDPDLPPSDHKRAVPTLPLPPSPDHLHSYFCKFGIRKQPPFFCNITPWIPGILRDKTMDKLMYIPNDVSPILFIKKFGYCLFETINLDLVKVPKVFSQRIRECGYKTLGTIIIFSPMFPTSRVNPKFANFPFWPFPSYFCEFCVC